MHRQSTRSLLTSKYPLLLNMASKMLPSSSPHSCLLLSSFPTVSFPPFLRVPSNALHSRHTIFRAFQGFVLHNLVLFSCFLAGPEPPLLELDNFFSLEEAGLLLYCVPLYCSCLYPLHSFLRRVFRLRQDERLSKTNFWPRKLYIAPTHAGRLFSATPACRFSGAIF